MGIFNLPISASLGPATSAAGPNGPENSAYVTLQRLDGRGFNPVDQEDLSSGGGSLTPVVTPTSPTSLASAASIHASVASPPMAAPSSGNNSGYITVDQANKMILKQNTGVNSNLDPRAYSKVAIAPISPSSSKSHTIDSPNGTNSTNSASSTPSAATPTAATPSLVMSAKDLQVETRPPFMKVVTTLDDGNSATRSTMV